jgi:anthranilate 1,2-dioxygenase small subunit
LTTREARLDALLLHHEVESFNAAYAAALDEGRLTEWAEMFTEDAFYVVISRENADSGLPVGLIYCDSKRMIHDRAFALAKTTMFAPRYLRHIIGNLQVLGTDADGGIRARANYALIQVLYDRPEAKLHQVGAYHDVFRRVGGALKLAERRCVYDSLLIDNALCLPV